jgi:hypothetical protein
MTAIMTFVKSSQPRLERISDSIGFPPLVDSLLDGALDLLDKQSGHYPGSGGWKQPRESILLVSLDVLRSIVLYRL